MSDLALFQKLLNYDPETGQFTWFRVMHLIEV